MLCAMARRMFVRGDVQGVGFRAWTQRTAHALSLNGWVRNRYDGRVEIHAEGEESQLDALLDASWHGPRSAHVEDVTSMEVENESPRGFSIFPTA